MVRVTEYIRSHLPLLAYLVLLAGVLLANVQVISASKSVDRVQQREALAGCERGNDLRRAINAKDKSFMEHNEATTRLFVKISRLLPSTSMLRADVAEAAREHRVSAKRYRPLSLISCDQAYKGQ